MRRWIAALGALGWAACQARLGTVTVQDSSTTTVEHGTIVEEWLADLGFDDFLAMDLTTSEELENRGVEPGDITDARLVMLQLEAISPEGADLSFIQEMSVYVEAPGLDRVLVAHADSFPEGEAVVDFDVTGTDIVDHVVSRSMTLTTETRAWRPSEDTVVEARFAVEVGATLQGACGG